MRVLFTTLRVPSHFLPLVPFVEACRSRGHEVGVAAPEDLRERVERTGATFFPFGHPGDAGLEPIWARMRQAPKPESMRIAIGELFAGACASAALPQLIETVERWRPSIIVRESQEYAAIIAADKAGIPCVRVGITGRHNEAEIMAIAKVPVDALGRGVGRSPDPDGARLKRERVLTLFPESLDTHPEGSAPALRFRASRGKPPPLPAWWPELSGPFVYATLGTVTGGMELMRSAYRVVLDALVGLPVRVLLTIGSDLSLEILGAVPPNVHVERFVAQDDVIPHAAAILCHGGSGTMLGAVAAGVPLVVAPMFADQPQNAERIALLGAGLGLPPREATAETVRSALVRVLEEPSFRIAAQRIAQEIASLPPADEASAELERLL
jgi:UDP:flavonoid glycosyltransferase YjiC (YdhE family)